MELISWKYLNELVGENVKWCNVIGINFERFSEFCCDLPLKFNNGICGIYIRRFELLLVPESNFDVIIKDLDNIEREELVFDNWDLEFIEEIPTITSSTYSINELSRNYSLGWDLMADPSIKLGKYKLTSYLFEETFEIVTIKEEYYSSIYIGHRLSKDIYSSFSERSYYFNLFQLILLNKVKYVITRNY